MSLAGFGFRVYAPEKAHYVLVDMTSIGFDDDLDFYRMLPKPAGVAAIPCSFFWKDRSQGRELVRFCFCKRDETLKEGTQRLRQWLKAG